MIYIIYTEIMKINSFEESPSSLLCWFFLLLFIGLCIGSVQWLPDHHFCLQSWQDLDTLSSLEPQQVIPICESRWLLASSPKTLILQLRRILHAILHWPKSTLFGYPDTLPPYARSAPLCLAGPQTPLSTTPGYLTHLSGLCQSLISIWTRLRRKWRAKTRSNLANFIKTRISTSVASILPNNFSMFSSTSRTRPLLYCLQRFLRPGFFLCLIIVANRRYCLPLYRTFITQKQKQLQKSIPRLQITSNRYTATSTRS